MQSQIIGCERSLHHRAAGGDEDVRRSKFVSGIRIRLQHRAMRSRNSDSSCKGIPLGMTSWSRYRTSQRNESGAICSCSLMSWPSPSSSATTCSRRGLAVHGPPPSPSLLPGAGRRSRQLRCETLVARGRRATEWRDFEQARAVAHSLKVRRRHHWLCYVDGSSLIASSVACDGGCGVTP